MRKSVLLWTCMTILILIALSATAEYIPPQPEQVDLVLKDDYTSPNPDDVPLVLGEEEGTPDLNLSFGPDVDVFRWIGCGPQITNDSAEPEGQTLTKGIDYVCNNGTVVGNVSVYLESTPATGWELYVSNESPYVDGEINISAMQKLTGIVNLSGYYRQEFADQADNETGQITTPGIKTIDDDETNFSDTIVDDDSIGIHAWSNPTNAKESNNTYATASCSGEGCVVVSHYLKATNFNFSIPTDAIIEGIKAEVEISAYCIYGCNSWVRLVLPNGTLGSTIKNNDTSTTTEKYLSYGNSTDLWGEGWTAEDINNASFGIAFNGTNSAGPSSSMTYYVDHMRITVYWHTIGSVDEDPPTDTNITLMDYSGVYDMGTSTFNAKSYDGNWSSYELGFELLINYTKPTYSTNDSLWQIKAGGGAETVNRSILQSCWDYNSDKLILKVFSGSPIGSDYNEEYCYNGSWFSLGKIGTGPDESGVFYEEAMWWDLDKELTETIQIKQNLEQDQCFYAWYGATCDQVRSNPQTYQIYNIT